MGLARKVGKTGRKINPRNAETVTYTAGEAIRKNAFVESYVSSAQESQLTSTTSGDGYYFEGAAVFVDDNLVLEERNGMIYLINVSSTPQMVAAVESPRPAGPYCSIEPINSNVYAISKVESGSYDWQYIYLVKVDGTQITVGNVHQESAAANQITTTYTGAYLLSVKDEDVYVYSLNLSTLDITYSTGVNSGMDYKPSRLCRLGGGYFISSGSTARTFTISGTQITFIDSEGFLRNANGPSDMSIDSNKLISSGYAAGIGRSINYDVESLFQFTSLYRSGIYFLAVFTELSEMERASISNRLDLSSTANYYFITDGKIVAIVSRSNSEVTYISLGLTYSGSAYTYIASRNNKIYVGTADMGTLTGTRKIITLATRIRESQSSILGIAQNAANAGEEVEVWQ